MCLFCLRVLWFISLARSSGITSSPFYVWFDSLNYILWVINLLDDHFYFLEYENFIRAYNWLSIFTDWTFPAWFWSIQMNFATGRGWHYPKNILWLEEVAGFLAFLSLAAICHINRALGINSITGTYVSRSSAYSKNFDTVLYSEPVFLSLVDSSLSITKNGPGSIKSNIPVRKICSYKSNASNTWYF